METERHRDFSVIEKKENPAICNSMMDPEGIILREISGQRKIHTSRYHLYMEPEKARLTETECRMVVVKGWEVGKCWGKVGQRLHFQWS